MLTTTTSPSSSSSSSSFLLNESTTKLTDLNKILIKDKNKLKKINKYEYFSNLNSLAIKIALDIKDGQLPYKNLWNQLNLKEQINIVNDIFIKPEISVLYEKKKSIKSTSEAAATAAAATVISSSSLGASTSSSSSSSTTSSVTTNSVLSLVEEDQQKNQKYLLYNINKLTESQHKFNNETNNETINNINIINTTNINNIATLSSNNSTTTASTTMITIASSNDGSIITNNINNNNNLISDDIITLIPNNNHKNLTLKSISSINPSYYNNIFYKELRIKNIYQFDGKNLSTYCKQKTGLKLINDDVFGIYPDEHSIPFSFKTKSQINLTLFNKKNINYNTKNYVYDKKSYQFEDNFKDKFEGEEIGPSAFTILNFQKVNKEISENVKKKSMICEQTSNEKQQQHQSTNYKNKTTNFESFHNNKNTTNNNDNDDNVNLNDNGDDDDDDDDDDEEDENDDNILIKNKNYIPTIEYLSDNCNKTNNLLWKFIGKNTNNKNYSKDHCSKDQLTSLNDIILIDNDIERNEILSKLKTSKIINATTVAATTTTAAATAITVTATTTIPKTTTTAVTATTTTTTTTTTTAAATTTTSGIIDVLPVNGAKIVVFGPGTTTKNLSIIKHKNDIIKYNDDRKIFTNIIIDNSSSSSGGSNNCCGNISSISSNSNIDNIIKQEKIKSTSPLTSASSHVSHCCHNDDDRDADDGDEDDDRNEMIKEDSQLLDNDILRKGFEFLNNW